MLTVKSRPRTRVRGRSVVLEDIRWETYESLVNDVERQRVRITYDRGTLEIMSPSNLHERFKKWLGMMVAILAEEFATDFIFGGSQTFKLRKLKKGVEPDQCYWIANYQKIMGKKTINLAKDPPPDLVIEVDITSSSLDRMKIYGAMKVPEIWRFDGSRLFVYVLDSTQIYQTVLKSPAFPDFPLDLIESNIERPDNESDLQAIGDFRRLARKYAAS